MPDFNKIASKWQHRWEKSKIFKIKSPNKKKKFYCLEMFPYASGYGQHMGHVRNYTMGDVYSRFKRMQGYNVLYPMGYDSFGLPAENAAIKEKSHPKIFTEKAITSIIKQQKALGNSYDWSRLIATHTQEYYKWNQLLFLKFFDNGLVYRKEAPINYCNSCKTVLANEQVIQGKCWRCDNQVEIKQLEQWFLKTTEYADELLKDIDKLSGWPERIKVMQKNWIGKNYGTLVEFPIHGSNKKIPIFTTRPDTLFGVTFMVYAPEHPNVLKLVKGSRYEKEVKKFIDEVVIEEKFTRTAEDKEKEGLFIGKYAINPLTNEKIPIYIANFVLLEYGTGAVMAVPAHDQRDFEFAKKHDIKIKIVIRPKEHELNHEKMTRAYVDEGVLVNSKQFSGMNNIEAVNAITEFLKKNKLGKKTVQYKLRDWLISRQRYWGTPIPIIYCKKCGIVKIPEKDLPVLLPEKVKFSGHGNPLAKVKSFVNVKCSKCKSIAKRETDTMDTFFDSSWYFLRFCSPNDKKSPFDKRSVKYWMPVDQYIGGEEHATGHLLYARFFVKTLRDLKFLNFDEPFVNLFNQGMLLKGNEIMSKSKGNIVTQESISNKYGIDTARFFLMFVASPDKSMEWSDHGVEGSFRFLNKFYSLIKEKSSGKNKLLESRMNKLIRDITSKIENFEYNSALIDIMEFTKYIKTTTGSRKKAIKNLILLISPFTPHLAEEMWQRLGYKGFVSLQKWPGYDKRRINLKLEEEQNLVIRTKEDLNNILKLVKIKKPREVILYIADAWKYRLYEKVKKELKKDHDISRIIKASLIKGKEREISSLVPRLVKNTSKIPEIILDEKIEIRILKSTLKDFEKEFRLKFKIATDNGKAFPGKPAILIQ